MQSAVQNIYFKVFCFAVDCHQRRMSKKKLLGGLLFYLYLYQPSLFHPPLPSSFLFEIYEFLFLLKRLLGFSLPVFFSLENHSNKLWFADLQDQCYCAF